MPMETLVQGGAAGSKLDGRCVRLKGTKRRGRRSQKCGFLGSRTKFEEGVPGAHREIAEKRKYPRRLGPDNSWEGIS